MVRIDGKLVEEEFPNDQEISGYGDDTGNEVYSLDGYAKEVVETMSDDNIPPLPSNYKSYFEKLLDDKSGDIKQQIIELMDIEDTSNADKILSLEHNVKENFIYIKQMLNVISTIYKNSTIMQELLIKKEKELEASSNALHVKNIAHSLKGDLKSLADNTKNQNIKLKELYQKSISIIKEVSENTIYDSKYELYNQKYFLKQLESELKLVKEFRHSSCVLMLKVHQDTLRQLNKIKTQELVTRTVSKLLLKTSRRSDIIAHYGEGHFTMLLKNTNLEGAKRNATRLRELVKESNFFLGDNEIILNIAVGLQVLDPQSTLDTTMQSLIMAVNEADMHVGIDYIVAQATYEEVDEDAEAEENSEEHE
jgi:diguanylate cyclase (GGDEF)-like protein